MHTEASLDLGPIRVPIAVVPLRRWDKRTLKGLRVAIGLAPEVVAVQVLTGDREDDDLTDRRQRLAVAPAERLGAQPPKLVVLRSEYRQLLSPLLKFVKDLASERVDRQVAVIVPELVERRWYHAVLHSHVAALFKALLVLRGGPHVVVVSTPWYLGDCLAESEH
jgi:hypothetical protein